jgi:signal transduction histidine kinase
VDSFRATANAHEVDISLQLDERLPVTADGFRVRQVIDNLVSNAIKYTSREGRVRIIGELEGETVSLVVADNGIGIAASDLPNILTPYFRTEKAKETASGTGLGLGITREIVAAHGGTLSIDSVAGVGTTVSVRLPRSEHAVAASGTETRA